MTSRPILTWLTDEVIAKAREHPDLMDIALMLKLQYPGSDLTAVIAALLMKVPK